jgi:hypothetical protein
MIKKFNTKIIGSSLVNHQICLRAIKIKATPRLKFVYLTTGSQKFGYFQVSRDVQFSYTCLNHAASADTSSASGEHFRDAAWRVVHTLKSV